MENRNNRFGFFYGKKNKSSPLPLPIIRSISSKTRRCYIIPPPIFPSKSDAQTIPEINFNKKITNICIYKLKKCYICTNK